MDDDPCEFMRNAFKTRKIISRLLNMMNGGDNNDEITNLQSSIQRSFDTTTLFQVGCGLFALLVIILLVFNDRNQLGGPSSDRSSTSRDNNRRRQNNGDDNNTSC